MRPGANAIMRRHGGGRACLRTLRSVDVARRPGWRASLRSLRPALVSVMVLVLPACGWQGRAVQAQDRTRAAAHRIDTLERDHARQLNDAAQRRAAQDVPHAWLAGRARPLARELRLPEPLRRRIDATLLYTDRPDLPQLAQRIRRATAIPVRILPDALLPPERFLPRLNGVDALDTHAGTLLRRAELESGPQPLADLLDGLAARLYVHWRYQAGAIEFYRTDTRVFDVRMLAVAAHTRSQLGRSASGKAEGFDHGMQTAMSSGDGNGLAALRARVLPFLSKAGVVSEVTANGGALVVTDLPEILDRIEAYVARENRAATRRVRILLEELTLSRRDRDERGIDWALIFSRASAALNAAGPAAAAGQGAALLGAGVSRGQWRGSQAMLDVLAEAGVSVHRRSIPLLTLNRQPVTHAVHSTFSYVDHVQGGVIGGTTAQPAVVPSISVSQKRETVGTFVTILPDARDDGSILLSIGYDNSYAQPLRTLSFGPADSQLRVQQLNLDGHGTVQQVALRPGQPVLLAGFDARELDSDTRRLTRGAPLLAGGRDSLSDIQQRTVLLITAQLEDGDV